jgi:hypothetical protein
LQCFGKGFVLFTVQFNLSDLFAIDDGQAQSNVVARPQLVIRQRRAVGQAAKKAAANRAWKM